MNRLIVCLLAAGWIGPMTLGRDLLPTHRLRVAATNCASTACLYVANGRHPLQGLSTVTIYDPSADGNVRPLRSIAGRKTLLQNPWAVTLDDAQRIYVTNPTRGGAGYVAIYAAGANGNVAPVQTIGTGHDSLCYPFGIAVIAGNQSQTVYVANSGCGGQVAVYDLTPGGATLRGRIAGPQTGLAYPWGIAVGSAGDLYVADYGSDSITIYASNVFGDARPIRTIAGGKTGLSGPAGIAVAPNRELYVSNFNADSVTVYAPGADGDVAPVATIAGSQTTLDGPLGIRLDASQAIYVSNYYGASVAIFAEGSQGNVAPSRTIAGLKTLLRFPQGIALR